MTAGLVMLEAGVSASPGLPGYPAPALPQLGRYDAALRDYEAALGLEPGSSYAHYNAGIVRDRLGQYAAAVAAFSAAIALEPRNADFYHVRGWVGRCARIWRAWPAVASQQQLSLPPTRDAWARASREAQCIPTSPLRQGQPPPRADGCLAGLRWPWCRTAAFRTARWSGTRMQWQTTPARCRCGAACLPACLPGRVE